MANATDILNAINALRTPATATKDKKIAAIKAIAMVLNEASNNGMILALIQPTDDELEKLQTEARSALELVKSHKDELTDAQVNDILAGLRKAYADADKRAMDGLVGKVEENPEAETIANAIEPEPEFDPETDLELQDDDLDTGDLDNPEPEAEPEAEDPLVKAAKEIKEKAPQIVNLLKTIFG